VRTELEEDVIKEKEEEEEKEKDGGKEEEEAANDVEEGGGSASRELANAHLLDAEVRLLKVMFSTLPLLPTEPFFSCFLLL